MLPTFGSLEPNLLTVDAREAAEDAIARLKATRGPGMIQRDRLERNLLSSQPLCFNLFGEFRKRPQALLPWVLSLRSDAVRVTRVELEIAPVMTPLGGSAFDAYIEYELDLGRGFLGIECKYAEDLSKAQQKKAAAKYRDATTSRHWREGSVEQLDRPRLRQFWYNTLLAQLIQADGGFKEGMSVVVAMAQDESARDATAHVRSQLLDQSTMGFSSLQDVVALVEADESWKKAFSDRYMEIDHCE